MPKERCPKCHLGGHRAGMCPYKRDICDFCGGKGHVRSICNCSRRYTPTFCLYCHKDEGHNLPDCPRKAQGLPRVPPRNQQPIQYIPQPQHTYIQHPIQQPIQYIPQPQHTYIQHPIQQPIQQYSTNHHFTPYKQDRCDFCGGKDHVRSICNCLKYRPEGYCLYCRENLGHNLPDCPRKAQGLPRVPSRNQQPKQQPKQQQPKQHIPQPIQLPKQQQPKQQQIPQQYSTNHRFTRNHKSYSWGRDPNAYQKPIYVRALPEYLLPYEFECLLPSDFADKQQVGKQRRVAFNQMRNRICQILIQNKKLNDVIQQQQQIQNPDVIDDELTTTTTIPKFISKTIIRNPLAVAAEVNDVQLASELLRYAVYAEESVQLIDIVAYTQQQINVNKDEKHHQDMYSVVIEGVGEGRPSVMRGDRVILSEGPGKPTYGGMVHFVNVDEIIFTLPYHYNRQYSKMDLIFVLPRNQERAYHRVLSRTDVNWFLTNDLCLSSTFKLTTLSQQFHFILEKKKDISSSLSSSSSKATITTTTPTIIDYDNNNQQDNISQQNVETSLLTSTTFYNFSLAQQQQQQQSLLFPTNVALNEKQADFVAHVLNLQHRVSLLFGPPGTGKTSTLVYAIAEVLLRAPNAKILVVCPSNDAADLIIERFELYLDIINKIHNIKHILLRIHALSRGSHGTSDIVMKYSKPTGRGGFFLPCIEEINNASIIVTTMLTADRIYSLGGESNFFTHLFVDEAGHATEQLLALPLAVASQSVKCVLAGDPCQLGPRIRADPLIHMKLQESTLKRLMEDEKIWSQCGIQLMENYRSHPAIIYLINVFYNDTLLPASISHGGRFINHNIQQYYIPNNNNNIGEKNQQQQEQQQQNQQQQEEDNNNNKYLKWSYLKNNKVPIYCLNHISPEQRDKNSPSWYNAFECNEILNIIISLVFKEKICELKDIAIITPYLLQAKHIRDKIYWELVERDIIKDQKPRLPLPIRVASVDSFQGREADVVILSCVRSNIQHASHDIRFNIGFLSQPERSNVAISRARNLLIILGNLQLLSYDPTFKKYVQRMKELDVIIDYHQHHQHITSNQQQQQQQPEQQQQQYTNKQIQTMLNMVHAASHRGDYVDDEGDDITIAQMAHESAWIRHE